MEGERLPVKVRYYGTESYSDLAPMLDELEARFGSLDFTVSRPDPNALGQGGPFPVALAITVDLNSVGDVVAAGAALVAGGFLTELGKEGAKAFRQKLLKIPVLSPSPRRDLSLTAVSFMMGTVQFYIGSPMTEQELASAFQQAAELVAEMPEGRVNNPSGASGWPIIWDPTSQTWQDAALHADPLSVMGRRQHE
jgi:hypothetical protein